MTQIYYAVNGKEEKINKAGNDFLAKLTFCLWDKVGIPRPLSEADAKLVARILRNYVTLQEITKKDKSERYIWRMMGYTQDDEGSIEWTKRIAQFFEESGGLREE